MQTASVSLTSLRPGGCAKPARQWNQAKLVSSIKDVMSTHYSFQHHLAQLPPAQIKFICVGFKCH